MDLLDERSHSSSKRKLDLQVLDLYPCKKSCSSASFLKEPNDLVVTGPQFRFGKRRRTADDDFNEDFEDQKMKRFCLPNHQEHRISSDSIPHAVVLCPNEVIGQIQYSIYAPEWCVNSWKSERWLSFPSCCEAKKISMDAIADHWVSDGVFSGFLLFIFFLLVFDWLANDENLIRSMEAESKSFNTRIPCSVQVPSKVAAFPLSYHRLGSPLQGWTSCGGGQCCTSTFLPPGYTQNTCTASVQNLEFLSYGLPTPILMPYHRLLCLSQGVVIPRYGNSNAIEVEGPVDISAEDLAKYLKPRWSLRAGAEFIKIPKTKNVFTVEFVDPEDYDRVQVFGPYHYRLRAILISKFNAIHAPIHHYPFEVVVWVQADGLPRPLRHFAVAKRIGNFIGRFMAYDSSDDTRSQGIIRFKVRLIGSIALPRGVTLLTRFQKFVATFKFEKLPIYCYRCGHLDHTLLECHKYLDHPLDPEPFSITLRAGSFGVWFLQERAKVETLHTPTLENPNPIMDSLDFPDMADNGPQIPTLKINNHRHMTPHIQPSLRHDRQDSRRAREQLNQSYMHHFHNNVVTALRSYSPPSQGRAFSSSPSTNGLSPRAAIFESSKRFGNGRAGPCFEIGSSSGRSNRKGGIFKSLTDWACKDGVEIKPLQISSSSGRLSEGASSSLGYGNNQAGTAGKQPRLNI